MSSSEEDVSYEEVEVTDSGEGEGDSDDDGRRVEWPPKDEQAEEQKKQQQLEFERQQAEAEQRKQQQLEKERQQVAKTVVQTTTTSTSSVSQETKMVQHQQRSTSTTKQQQIVMNGKQTQQNNSTELAAKGFSVPDQDVYGIGKELFQPGKLVNRWNPTRNNVENGQQNQRCPKVKLLRPEEILQTTSTTHASYHVPPGTTRTRKAQENYIKRLEAHEHEDEMTAP